MKKVLKKNKLMVLMVLIYVSLFILRGDMALRALDNSSYYLIEMLQILPVIFMLTVSIDVLIPKEWIVKRLGKQSGPRGALLALAFGSLSAGPIYAAFPIAKTLHKKGASVGNVVIILSAWAVIKVPMLANEAKFLGPEFMVIRWLLTVSMIFVIALVMEKFKIGIKSSEASNKGAITIDQSYCVSCGICAKQMPELFHMTSTGAHLKEGFNEQEVPHKLNEIMAQCPTKAIQIQ